MGRCESESEGAVAQEGSGRGDRDVAPLGSWAEKGLKGRLRGRVSEWRHLEEMPAGRPGQVWGE